MPQFFEVRPLRQKASYILILLCIFLHATFILSAQEVLPSLAAEPVYNIADIMPAFDGDIGSYTAAELIYPDSARDKNEQGRCIVTFVVAKDGGVNSARVARSSGSPFLDSEAVRFITSMPKWLPGKIKDIAVNVHFSLPVSFVLNDPPQPIAKRERIVSCVTDPSDTNVYTVVNKQAKFLFNFEGFMSNHLIYPEVAGRAGTGGRVEHLVIVDQNGYFKTIELHKSSGNTWLDRAANDALFALIKMNNHMHPPCMPAIRDGKCVRNAFIIPTVFRDPSMQQQESGLTRSYQYDGR